MKCRRITAVLISIAALAITLASPPRGEAQIWGSNTGPGGAEVQGLLADPTRPGTVYAWSITALHRSDDAGQSWQTPASAGLSTYGFMVVDPTRGGALFTTTATGVYRSDDAGESWSLVNAIALEAIAVDAATGILYAGEHFARGVWRSGDGGATWTRVYELRTAGFVEDAARFIRTDPLHPGFVYLVSDLGWFYVSEDGGDTWEERKDLYRIYRGDGLTLEVNGFELDPTLPGVMYLAAADGIYRSQNAGSGWALRKKGLPQGLTIVAFAVDPAISGVLYAATRYSGVYRSIDGGAAWVRASAGLPGAVVTDISVSGVLVSMSADAADPERLYVGNDVGDVFVQTCGNAQVDAGEVCDDGNLVDGDGCSSKCRGESYLTLDEQRCVKGMNAKGIAAAKSQTKENLRCFDAGADGSEVDPQACLTADGLGRMAAARGGLERAEPRLCAVVPPYGSTSADDVADAAINEVSGLAADLFGGDLTAAQIDPTVDAAGAACQRAVVDATQRLLDAFGKTFLGCKTKRMKGTTWPVVGAAGDLGDCLEVEHPRLSRAYSRLTTAQYSTCAAVDQLAAFPNGHTLPFNHFQAQVRCRACRLVNRIDGLAHDCDAFDGDFVGSCP